MGVVGGRGRVVAGIADKAAQDLEELGEIGLVVRRLICVVRGMARKVRTRPGRGGSLEVGVFAI